MWTCRTLCSSSVVIFCTAKWLHLCSSAAGADPAPLGDEQDSEVDNALVRCVGWTIHSDWNYIILWHLPPLTHMHTNTCIHTHNAHTHHTCTHTCTYTHHTHVHAHTHMHTHTHTHTHVHTHTHMHTHTHTPVHTHTHTHMQAHNTHTCTHTHTGSVGCWNAGKPEVSGAARMVNMLQSALCQPFLWLLAAA